jgi:hypothetical protein
MSWAKESPICHLLTAVALAAAAVLTAAPADFDPDDVPAPPVPGSVEGPAAPAPQGPPREQQCAGIAVRPCNWIMPNPWRPKGVHKEANSS